MRLVFVMHGRTRPHPIPNGTPLYAAALQEPAKMFDDVLLILSGQLMIEGQGQTMLPCITAALQRLANRAILEGRGHVKRVGGALDFNAPGTPSPKHLVAVIHGGAERRDR